MAVHQVPRKFEAHLTGSQEVPPLKTDETGEFRARLSEHELEYRLLIRKVTGLTQAHIHLGQPGKVGPIVAFLYGLNAPAGSLEAALVSGSIKSENLLGPLKGQPLRELIKEIVRGNAYVDVHNNQYPDGRIRGQVQVYKQKESDSDSESDDCKKCDSESESKQKCDEKDFPWEEKHKEDEKDKKHKFPWEEKHKEDEKDKKHKFPWEEKGKKEEKDWDKYQKEKKKNPWDEDDDHKKNYPYPWEKSDWTSTSSSDEKDHGADKEKKHKFPWEEDDGWPWNQEKKDGTWPWEKKEDDKHKEKRHEGNKEDCNQHKFPWEDDWTSKKKSSSSSSIEHKKKHKKHKKHKKRHH
uniref:CHRD domain-containing protein n=1 Tax=viral metagenome TaxID=1070528 RepID=A0A6C0IYF7_9ZZZZ